MQTGGTSARHIHFCHISRIDLHRDCHRANGVGRGGGEGEETMSKIQWTESKIQWTEKTWNPIVGCSRVSPGCQHCYAEQMAKRLQAMGQGKYQGTIDKNGRWTGNLNFDIENYDAPLKRQKPTVYFVNSMSDLFHESIGFNWLMRVWNVMRDTPQHTYQILTKRADIMERTGKALAQIYGILPNVWLGVSVENQEYADKRTPHLLKTPAAVRFLSCEPLLGPISFDLIDGIIFDSGMPFEWQRLSKPGIDWVIVGGESGPGARPMNVRWIKDIVDQCKAASVAVFVKQLGACPIDDNYTYPTKDRKGGNLDEWPEDLRVREFPT